MSKPIEISTYFSGPKEGSQVPSNPRNHLCEMLRNTIAFITYYEREIGEFQSLTAAKHAIEDAVTEIEFNSEPEDPVRSHHLTTDPVS